MRYPTLKEIPSTRDMIDVFKGYNHNVRIGEGEFYEMTNLSSDNYPTISPRKPRGTYIEDNRAIYGMLARGDELWFAKYSKICKKTATEFEEYALGGIDPGIKTMISMGAYIIIMPDKKYINTANPEDKGDINSRFYKNDTNGFAARLAQCTANGKEYQPYFEGQTAPSITDEMLNKSVPIWWVDTSKPVWVLKEYNREVGQWYIADSYVKIYIPDSDIDQHFEVGDDINVLDFTLLDTSYKKIEFTSDNIVHAKGDDYIVINGVCVTGDPRLKTIDIRTTMPNMDFVIESNNRLWGCRYGENNNGDFVNEIYASKLGDFKHWTTYKGISTDSYVASVGASGPFTGAINYGGYPMFFKENCLYKIYGNYPAQYQIQEIMCNGVEEHSSKSLAIVNDILYYKSRVGICAYDGSTPIVISSIFGDKQYNVAVGGALENKYYVSMANKGTVEWNLFVYDTAKGLWHREDDLRVLEFCNCDGVLYYFSPDGTSTTGVKYINAASGEVIQWQAITGEIGANSPDKKSISRLDVRMRLSVGSEVIFFIEYDSSGEYEYLFTAKGTRLDTFTMPVKPKKCDHLRLKIMGVGDAQIYSITKTVEYGG